MALLSPACYNPTFGDILFKFSLMPMEFLAFCVRMHKGRFTWPRMNMGKFSVHMSAMPSKGILHYSESSE